MASLIALGISQANTTVSVTSITPQVSSNAIYVIATTGLGSLTPNVQINAVSVVATTGLGSVTPNTQANAVHVIATTGLGSVFGNVQVTVSITNATGTALGAAYEYGISEANATVIIGSVTPLAGQTVIPSGTSCSVTAKDLTVHFTGNVSISQATAITSYGIVTPDILVGASAVSTAATANPPSNYQVSCGVFSATAISGVGTVSASGGKNVIPSQASCTATVENVSVEMDIGISPAGVSASLGSTTPQVNIGISEASVSTSAGNITSNILISPTQAHATTVSESVTTTVGKSASVAQASCVLSIGQVVPSITSSCAAASASSFASDLSGSIFSTAI